MLVVFFCFLLLLLLNDMGNCCRKGREQCGMEVLETICYITEATPNEKKNQHKDITDK